MMYNISTKNCFLTVKWDCEWRLGDPTILMKSKACDAYKDKKSVQWSTFVKSLMSFSCISQLAHFSRFYQPLKNQ